MNLRKDHYRDTEVLLRSRRASQKERTRLTRAKGGARGEHAARRSKRTLRTRLEKKVPAQRDGCARDRRVAGDGRTDGRTEGESRARGARGEHAARRSKGTLRTKEARRRIDGRCAAADELGKAARVAKRTPFTSKSDCSRAMLAEDTIDAAGGGGRRDHRDRKECC